MLGGLIYHIPPQHAQAPAHWLVFQPGVLSFLIHHEFCMF